MNQGVICAEGPYEGKTWDDVKKIVVKGKGEAVWMSWPQSVRWRERTENDDLKEEVKRLNEENKRLNDEMIDLKFFRSLRLIRLSIAPGFKHPRTVTEYKELFDKLNIDHSDLKGSRAFKAEYDEFLTMFDFEEIVFMDVDYLEGEDVKIYNTNYDHVGSWNEDFDDIIWVNDKFREQHEALRS